MLFHVSSPAHLLHLSSKLNYFILFPTSTIVNGPGDIIPGGNHSLTSLRGCCMLLSPPTLNCSWIPNAFWVQLLLQQNSRYRCWFFYLEEEKKNCSSRIDIPIMESALVGKKKNRSEHCSSPAPSPSHTYPPFPSPFPTEWNHHDVSREAVASSPRDVSWP